MRELKFRIRPGGKIEQYIGIKDRHGIEIYEGDILYCGSLDKKTKVSLWN